MPTIVGGWRTTKKRGRDDETIERDRNEAIARRKELRKRKSSGSQSSVVARSKQVDHDSSSWKKTPCRNPRRRKHHSREPISPQRELFPKKSKLADDEIRTVQKSKNKSHHHHRNRHLLCKQCGDKIINPIYGKRPKRLPDSSQSITQSSRENCAARGHQRARKVVTPDQEHEQSHLCSDHQPKNFRKNNNKRGKPGAKVLSFGDEEDDASLAMTRFPASDFRNRGRRCSDTRRNNRLSKSKQRKLRLESCVTKQLKPEPDFARSARYFYETVRRPKQAVKHDGSDSMKDLLNNNREFNLVAGSLSSTSVVTYRRPLEHSKPLEQNYTVADTMARKSKSRTEVQFKFVQNLLLGKSIRNIENTTDGPSKALSNYLEKTIQSPREGDDLQPKIIANSIGSSSKEKKIEFRLEGEHGCKKATTNDTNGSNETEETANTRLSSNQLQLLSTQQEDINEQTSSSPKISETRKKRTMNEGECSLNQSTRAKKRTDTGTDFRSKNTTNHQPGQHFTQQYTNDENASPSQTPSTSSSALLSLPMNYHLFGSSQPSFDGSRSGNGNDQQQMNNSLCNADDTDKFYGPVENTRRENEDPLRDIGFWQRIVEREETKSKNNSVQRSFKHTIASLILAKNSRWDCNSSKHDNDGFLWLPSILEGGLGNTGLFEE
eukprot:CAMPEP_0116110498 /NCGR_PEP_ID=MMETSP0327-20121206/17940_1 /TAXON_ID=44447 /ORGANISM="Pseudo-nitzschia delicatissima, Strain B596" /LENGTH=662 /DNA_ID=CAMNT_0003603659 /DNA_START=44 /DNA_END=2032 /DNA_ORIENTATION=-